MAAYSGTSTITLQRDSGLKFCVLLLKNGNNTENWQKMAKPVYYDTLCTAINKKKMPYDKTKMITIN